MGPRGPTLYKEPRIVGLRSALLYWKIWRGLAPPVTSLAAYPNASREIDYLPDADAAWLTCCVHSVVELGLTSMLEPTSSNSKSSAAEPYWMRFVWF